VVKRSVPAETPNPKEFSMRHFARISVLLSSVFAISACGTSLAVRQPTSGSAVDRSMAVMESTMAILHQSKTAEEAIEKMGAYCSGEAIRMSEWRAEIEADEAMNDEMIKRFKKLMNEAQDTLDREKLGWMELEEMEAAGAGCRAD
jgi:hypothetical protein